MKLPNILENMIEDGSMVLMKEFQSSLFTIQEMYELSPRRDYSNAYRDYGVIPDSFVHDYYGVVPTPQYYYRR